MNYKRPNRFFYGVACAVCAIAARILFRRKFLRNEIKGVKGPFVVIANHETALDFVNLMGASGRPMSFVISKSIYSTLPCKRFLNKLGLIPKQQFQTETGNLKKMKAVIADGQGLVIYPAGLMCEDGLSTPIPAATYKFLKWLGADVYVARSYGTYFVLPKWSKKIRPGRTYLDIYKLFDSDELSALDEGEIRTRADAALLFDAYREQDGHRIAYRRGDNVVGLENVLYICPHCHKEFTVKSRDKHILQCDACGYAQKSDRFGMLHRCSTHGKEIRYVSDWNKFILSRVAEQVESGSLSSLSCETSFHMVSCGKYSSVGSGTVYLDKNGFVLTGTIDGSSVKIEVPIANIPSLPFSPGKHFEVQHGGDTYRCVLSDGRLAIKFINMLKTFNKHGG